MLKILEFVFKLNFNKFVKLLLFDFNVIIIE